ncbi:hypothetical protein BGZ46_003883, partial [Entomortierella lignicola]
TAEESVRVVDGLFGSTETSRALAAVVGLVKKEVYEDQEFAITNAGKMAVLASITKAITVFACLQAATHKRTQKTVRAMLVYEGVVVAKPKKLGANESTQLTTLGQSLEDDEDDGELLKDLSNALVTDPDDVTEDMTTTQIEKVLSADILQVTTTTTLTTTTTQTFVRPGADLSKLGKPLPPIQHEGEPTPPSLQRQQSHYASSIETASSSRGASSSLAITTRSRRGSVSSIASVATTLTQYATTSIVSNPHGSVKSTGARSPVPTASSRFTPSESLVTEGNRQANNNLRLMFSTVTKKFKRNQRVQVVGESDGAVYERTQERELRSSEARDSIEFSEDDGEWIEVAESSEITSSMAMNTTLSYDVPFEPKKNGVNGFGLKNGLSSKKFGKVFSKITKQSKKAEHRRSSENLTPQLTITEMDESRSGSDNSLSNKLKYDVSEAATPTLVEVNLNDNDDKDSRPPPPPKEPKEPNPANFPRDHLVRNIQRFMRYASASYGHNFMRILGIGTIGDTIYSPYGDHPNHHAFAAHTSTPLDSILLSSFTDPGTSGKFNAPKMHSLVHYINLDHGAQCVVLTCRGTLGLSDVLTDLCAHYEDLIMPSLGPNGERGEHHTEPRYKVHAGMHASAQLLSLETSTVFKTIKKALEDYPEYGLVLCGHSLGGGVASILSLLWSMKSQEFEAYLEEQDESSSDEEEDEQKSKTNGIRRKQPKPRVLYPEITTPFVTSPASGLPAGRPIHCYAYGPPCVMSLPLSRHCEGLVTTVVHQYDIVPTLSLGLLKDFKNVATTLHEEGQIVEDIVKRLIIGASSNKANADRQAAEEAKIASTTFTSSPNGSGPTPPPTPPKKDHPEAKRSQSMPMYSEYDRWQLQEAEDQDWSWSLIKTMRADMGSDKLYPPTPVYLLESIATTIVPPGTSKLEATTGAVAASMASRSSAAASVPLSKSFSASAVSAASAAAASLANGLRPGSPFGRSASPAPGAKATPSSPPSSFMPQVPKTAYKVSMRRFDHVEDRFGELQFARTMFTDHNPANYEVCVERLCQAVFDQEE